MSSNNQNNPNHYRIQLPQKKLNDIQKEKEKLLEGQDQKGKTPPIPSTRTLKRPTTPNTRPTPTIPSTRPTLSSPSTRPTPTIPSTRPTLSSPSTRPTPSMPRIRTPVGERPELPTSVRPKTPTMPRMPPRGISQHPVLIRKPVQLPPASSSTPNSHKRLEQLPTSSSTPNINNASTPNIYKKLDLSTSSSTPNIPKRLEQLPTSASTPSLARKLEPTTHSASAVSLNQGPSVSTSSPNLLPETKEEQPYHPISEKYRNEFLKCLYNLSLKSSKPDFPINPLSKSDFLNEDGYFTWLEHCEQTGEDASLFPLLRDLIELWDLEKPILENPLQNIKEKKKMPVIKPQQEITKVNLLLRVIAAKDLLKDHKDRLRNCMAVVTFKNEKNEEIRYETKVIQNTLEPYWNQQVTLQIHGLDHPIDVSLYHVKEKSNFFSGQKAEEEYLGGVRLFLPKLLTQMGKNGYTDDWYDLQPLEKMKKSTASGQLRLELEMAGIQKESGDVEEEVKHLDANTKEKYQKWKKLWNLKGKIVDFKISPKSLLHILTFTAHFLDFSPHKPLYLLSSKERRDRLSTNSLTLLNQFRKMLGCSESFVLLKQLECVFWMYKKEKCHARAVSKVYVDLREDYLKDKKILPQNEFPVLLDLLNDIEVYTSSQIKNYKEFFPVSQPKPSQIEKDFIRDSLIAIILLTRMIDKNPFFQDAQKDKKAEIQSYDYKNGVFSFKEKLKDRITSRAVVRYQQLSELAMPPVLSESQQDQDQVAGMLMKNLKLANLLMEELDQDSEIYNPGFLKDEELDICKFNLETFIKYYLLDMENLYHACDQQLKQSGKFMADAESEKEFIQSGFDLLNILSQMQQKWKLSQFRLQFWFQPFLQRHLFYLRNRLQQWTTEALQKDEQIQKLRPDFDEENNFYSTSVQDVLQLIFECLRDFKEKLAATRPLADSESFDTQNCFLMTQFAKIVYEIMEHYTDQLLLLPIDVTALTANAHLSAPTMESMFRFFSPKEVADQPVDEMGQEMKILTEEDFKNEVRSTRVSNLEMFWMRLKDLYGEMEGSKYSQIADIWRQRKYKKNSSPSDKISGMFKIEILACEDLRGKQNRLIATTTDPCVLLKGVQNEKSEILLQTPIASNSLSPHYFMPHLPQNKKEKEMFGKLWTMKPHYVISCEDLDAFELEVHHSTAATSSKSFLSFFSASQETFDGSQLLAKVRLPLQSQAKQWIQMEPQGKVYLSIEKLSDGLGSEVIGRPSSQLVNNRPFGCGAVEDLHYWFLKMEGKLSRSRQMLIQSICEPYRLKLEPKLQQLLQDVGNNLDFTDQQINDVMNELEKYLNTSISYLVPHLSDNMSQLIVYSIYLHACLYPLMHLHTPHPSKQLPTGLLKFSEFLNQVKHEQVSQPLRKQKKVWKLFWERMRTFFHADGMELGIPLAWLENGTGYLLGMPEKTIQITSLLMRH